VLHLVDPFVEVGHGMNWMYRVEKKPPSRALRRAGSPRTPTLYRGFSSPRTPRRTQHEQEREQDVPAQDDRSLMNSMFLACMTARIVS